MPWVVEDAFDELIPGAGDRAEQFLGVLRDRCNSAGIGIELRPLNAKEHETRSKRLILRGQIRIGRGRDLQLDVFADPVGDSLQVGWDISKRVAGRLARRSEFLRDGSDRRDRLDASYGSQRQRSGVLKAFHQTVFLPVVQLLIDAVERSSRGPSGFLGA